MPLLVPADSADLLDGQNAYCTTLDLGICFAAGTPVLLADGTTKPIEQIQPGDSVLSAPEDDAEAAPTAKTVERVFHNPPSELVCLTIAGQEIRSTPPHLFYVKEKGWTAAQDLQVGDELRTSDGRWVTLDAKKRGIIVGVRADATSHAFNVINNRGLPRFPSGGFFEFRIEEFRGHIT